MNIQNYAVSGTSPRRSASNPSRRVQGSSPLLSSYLFWGLVLLAVLILIPLLWALLSSRSTSPQETLRPSKTTPEPKYYEELDSDEYRLDLSKFKEDVSMNEFVNKELARMLPGVDLNDKFSVFLSSDISEKLMKLYHDESLNLFKTKVDEYEIHKNILKEKYNKGKSN